MKTARLELIETKDNDYFRELAEQDESKEYTIDELVSFFDKFYGKFWEIYHGGVRRGLIGWYQCGDALLFDGFKDKRIRGQGMTYSIEASKAVIAEMFKLRTVIFACSMVYNKAVQILIKKLGFKECLVKDNFIFYRKEKEN